MGISSLCSLRFGSLLCLLLQNATLVVLMRYSRSRHDRPMFLATTAVATDEMSKFLLSSVMIMINFARGVVQGDAEDEEEGKGKGGQSFLRFLSENVVTRYALLMAVPAALFTLQKNLLYIALTNLDACVYQVTYSAKLLTTALFSYLLLGRIFSFWQLAGLVMLMVGVALVQVSQADRMRKPTGEHPVIGIAAVSVACVTSGFASVYFEYWLKKSQDFWVKQAQLSFFAAMIALTGVVSHDWVAVREHGFYQGWDYIVCLTVACEAGGGIIVAVVIKYADSVAKNFATALSLLATTAMSWLFWDFEVSVTFVVGAALTLMATHVYQSGAPPVSKDNLGKATFAVVLLVLFWVTVSEWGLAKHAVHSVFSGSAHGRQHGHQHAPAATSSVAAKYLASMSRGGPGARAKLNMGGM
mmetsp:Transcript_1332/g.3523  ORF Transcript_1332/g.3523 Transcript_1332/m.3523 type:complete len:414 (+) Transcript_1332:73-1314(+)